MDKLLDHLRFAPTHEWVGKGADGELIVGITDFAQDQLGDVVYVSLPEPGAYFRAGEVCMVIESVKTASDIYMPVNGTIVSVNETLETQPELINQDAFNRGWLFKLHADSTASIEHLMDCYDYDAWLDE